MAVFALPELMEVGAFVGEGIEAGVAGVEGLFGIGESATIASETAAVTGSEALATTATNIGVQATTSSGLTAAGTAAESSALGGTEGTSFLSRLPTLTAKRAAIGATVGGAGIYHLGKDVSHGDGVLQSIENIPGHFVHDTSKIASGFGGGAGQIVAAGLGGASTELLGGKDRWWEYGLAGLAAYWFLTKG